MCYLWIIWWWSKSNVLNAKYIQIRRKNKEKKFAKNHIDQSTDWRNKQTNKQTNRFWKQNDDDDGGSGILIIKLNPKILNE